MKEVIYKSVVGYEGLYEVSSLGEVFSLNYHLTGKRVKLKPGEDREGYLCINLYKSGKMRRCSVHRLVAEAFIPNPDSKPQIDHINAVRYDNRVENLRWCTCKENHHNPITEVSQREVNVKNFAKAVYCVELNNVFESASEAARRLRLNFSHILECCRGERKTTGGYHFQFHIQE